MPAREVRGTVTFLLPSVLHDVAADAIAEELRSLAGDPAVRHLRLDASRLRAVSTKGLGLLAGVHLVVTRRGGRLGAFGCTPATQRRLGMARIPATPRRALSPPAQTWDHEDGYDWTPWWSGAAANA